VNARIAVAAEGEDLAKIVGQRDHHDLADQIGGRDLGAVVEAGADAALDVEDRGTLDDCVALRSESHRTVGYTRGYGRLHHVGRLAYAHVHVMGRP
jgi:hypothetical protein